VKFTPRFIQVSIICLEKIEYTYIIYNEMNSKKILYVNKQYRSYDFLKYLTITDECELTVIWICPFDKKDPIPNAIKKKLKFVILGFMGNRLQPWHLSYSFKLFKLIMKNGRNVDLIISTTSDAWHSKVVFLAGRILKKPTAFRKEVWFRNKSFLRNLYYSMTVFIEKHANAMFYPGIKQKEFLLSYHVSSDKLLPFPYLIEELPRRKIDNYLINNLKKELKDNIVFLYLGRIIYRKGLDLLIESFSMLEKSCRNVRLIIIGGPFSSKYKREHSEDYYKYCKNLAAKKSKNITFLGEVAPSLVRNYYHMSDVFVHPHRRYLSKNRIIGEGWGNVVVEAASAGLPCVLTDRVPSAFELVENYKNGIIVDSEDIINNLYDAMKYFVDNRDKINSFGEHSRYMYEKYNDPLKIINSINSIFKK